MIDFGAWWKSGEDEELKSGRSGSYGHNKSLKSLPMQGYTRKNNTRIPITKCGTG